MDDEAAAIRDAIAALDRQTSNEAVPWSLRARAARYALARRPDASWSELGRALGVAASTVRRWCVKPVGEAFGTTEPVLLPVVLQSEAAANATSGPRTPRTVTLVSPRGFRLEGLRFDEAVRALGLLS
jgi:hypothetical protein